MRLGERTNPDPEALRRHAPHGPGSLGHQRRPFVPAAVVPLVRSRAPAQAPLAFRTRDDVAVLWLAVLGLVAGIWGWASLLPVIQSYPWVEGAYWVLVVAWGLIAAWVVLIARGEILVDGAGLRFRSLLRREEIAWRDVQEIALTRGGFFRSPAVVLKLVRPRQLLPLSWTDPCHFRIGLHWERRELLVGEIAARASAARASRELVAYLEDPHRVAWRHRLATLASAALSAILLGYAFIVTLAWDSASFLPIGLALASCGVCCTLAGGAIDNEWRWKSCLVRAGGVLGLAIPCASLSAIFLGACGVLILVLAGCFGWAVVSFLIALPVRPITSSPRWVAAGYGAALAAALVPAWWYGVREPLPSRTTDLLSPGPSQIIWSPDGARLYGMGKPNAAYGQPVCHIVDAETLGARTLPLGDLRCCWLYPTRGPHLLYRATPHEGAKRRELWALDTQTEESKLLYAAPSLSVASEGCIASDGREAVFLAGSSRGTEMLSLRLEDLSVRPFEPSVDVSRFDSVRWQSDGTLLFVERPRAETGHEAVAFWALAPGAVEPRCIYRAAAPFLAWGFSPDVRWALVGAGPGWQTVDRCEMVDLATGARRALAPPLPAPGLFPRLWAPDGSAIAYAAFVGNRQAVLLVDPATGQARRVHETRDHDIAFVSLSPGARYVACAINHGLGAQGRIVDTQTGRVIRLNGIGALQPLVWFAWSPEGSTLAVASFGSPPLRDRPTALRLYRLQP